MVDPHRGGILCSNKKEQLLEACSNLDGSQGKHAELKKPISKGPILYDSIHRIFLKSPNFGDEETLPGVVVVPAWVRLPLRSMMELVGTGQFWILRGRGWLHEPVHMIELHSPTHR